MLTAFKTRAAAWLLLVVLSQPAAAQGLLPLDDRPCNLLFPRQLARIAGMTLETPPRHLLGKAYTAGECEKLAGWLVQSRSPLLFVSSDMLCYGGLIASRAAATSREDALRRVALLEQLHRQGRRLQVLGTLPRLHLRTSEEQAPYEEELAKWATRPEASPPPFADEYRAVRQRNLDVLLRLVELVEQGVVEKLVIGQDDSAPAGLHVEEQARLREEVARRGVGARVVLLSGADELGMDMVAGWLAHRYGVHPTVTVVYDDPQAAHSIPPLESLPLAEMVSEHLKLCGLREGPRGDVTLMVQTPLDHPFRLPAPSQEPRAHSFVEQVAAQMKKGPVALANLGLVNRMDPYVAEAALSHLPVWKLQGLAGWNTPANALGTVTAQLLVRQVAQRLGPAWTPAQRLESASTHAAFLFARMLDDYAYQAVLRTQLYPRARQLPLIYDPLLNLHGPLGLEARLWLREWGEKEFAQRWQGREVALPGGGTARLERLGLEVVLPWPRLFEVEARVHLNLLPSPSGRNASREVEPQGFPSPRASYRSDGAADLSR